MTTPLPLRERLIVALDTDDEEKALQLVQSTRKVAGVFKVGLELFSGWGPELVAGVSKQGTGVFLDLKLHDIPNTVAGAVRQASRHGATYLTVHALGGPEMLKAAVAALSDKTTIPGMHTTQLLAVTLLTHHTPQGLEALGLSGNPEKRVVDLARMAQDAGITGCVCSPREAAAVREAVGNDFRIVCPGVRPEGADHGDQARVATPFEAMKAGADALVVGRPITRAPDPEAAARRILDEMERGLAERQKP
jgi:orotidine-5'-phosphate decarboxylase